MRASALAILLSSALSSALWASSAQAASPSPLSDHAPEVAPRADWRAPIPQVKTTPSGMKVLVLHQPSVPLVTVLVNVHAGSARDPKGQPGLAAATAAFLREGGAGNFDAASLRAQIADLGGELQVEPSKSDITLFITVLSTKLDRALALLSDVVARPRFAAADFPASRDRLVAKIVRNNDDPREIADQVFAHVLYGDHPYGHPDDGRKEAVAQLTVHDVQAFYAAHYGPRAVSVILVGDTDPTTAERAVERAFASNVKWNLKVAPPAAPVAPKAGPPRIVLVDRPGAPQSVLRVGDLAIAGSSPEVPAATLIAKVLGGSFTSRLNQNLREKHGYTYGAFAGFDFRRAVGPFIAETAVRTDVTAPAIHEILHELAAIRAPLGKAESDKGRALLAQQVIDQLGDGMSAALLYSELLSSDRPLDFWSTLPHALAGLTLPAIAHVASALIRPDQLTIVVVGDAKKVEPGLRALGLHAPIERCDVYGDPIKR